MAGADESSCVGRVIQVEGQETEKRRTPGEAGRQKRLGRRQSESCLFCASCFPLVFVSFFYDVFSPFPCSPFSFHRGVFLKLSELAVRMCPPGLDRQARPRPAHGRWQVRRERACLHLLARRRWFLLTSAPAPARLLRASVRRRSMGRAMDKWARLLGPSCRQLARLGSWVSAWLWRAGSCGWSGLHDDGLCKDNVYVLVWYRVVSPHLCGLAVTLAACAVRAHLHRPARRGSSPYALQDGGDEVEKEGDSSVVEKERG